MKRREEDEAGQRWARATLDGDGTRRHTGPSGGGAGILPAWSAAWAALELPPPSVPAGFSRRVAGVWSDERARAAAPLLGAAWMRAAAAAALLAGAVLGGTLSWGTGNAAGEAVLADEEVWWTASLSEEYLEALSGAESTSGTDGEGDDSAGSVSSDAAERDGQGERVP